MLTGSVLTPRLPSGQEMRDDRMPVPMQEQLHSIALQVLQRLLGPLVRRYRLGKARRTLLQQYVAQHTSAAELESAAVSALQHTSFLGAVTRDFYTASAVPANTGGGGVDAAGVARSPTSSTAAATPASQEMQLHSYPAAGPGASLPSVDATAAAELHEEVRRVVGSALVHYAVHLQEESLEWEFEPASEVLVLLAGAVERRGAAVAVHRGRLAALGSAGTARRASALVGGHTSASSRMGSISHPAGPRRASASLHPQPPSLQQQSSLAATTPGFLRRTSAGHAHDRASSASAMSIAAHSSTPNMQAGAELLCGEGEVQRLAAPQVFGELACLGAFPYCAALVVTSPTALVVRVPKEVYCQLVSVCVPVEGQRRLLTEALQLRERLLPYYAPLTASRLQLCPLLSRLRPEQLEHVRDLAIPRVYAAGMECGERESPQHIFFVRRGVVHMQRDGSTAGAGGGGGGGGAGSTTGSDGSSPQAALARASYSLELPKNRPVLVEGHTYGETGCIFGDALGDRYTAITHVDMYLLPFQVLIQLMKQVPEVQSTIYHSAQELSFLRDKEWRGALFGPRLYGAELPGVHGVVPAQGLLASMAAATSAVGGLGGFAPRRESGVGGGLDPLGRGSAVRGGHGPGAPRRVTIFEDASATGNAGDRAAGADHAPNAGLAGGRVSSALLSAMEQLPVISLLPNASASFYKACMPQWQCVSYAKGDVIAAAGEECNRVLFFFEGQAGVVCSAAVLKEELRPGPFGVADISSVGPEAICPIPAGHAVGFTCVRRHRWSRSIVALDDVVEVWEMRRPGFVQLLRTHGMEREMQVAALQLLQPLSSQRDRLAVLDYQPLLHPMPNSLWRQQAVPNVHPVVTTNEGAACFPVWREGDFPLNRHTSIVELSARAGGSFTGGGGRRSTLNSVGAVKLAAIVNERQRTSAQRGSDSPQQQQLSGVRGSGSVAALSDSDNAARSAFVARMSAAV